MEPDQKTKDANLKMVDISGKENSLRTACAEGFIMLESGIIKKILAGTTPKGDVLAVAKVAGILAAKKTPDLIPMCHNISITNCEITYDFSDNGIKVTAVTSAYDRTGVEMEALTAVSVVLLNIYDMVKSLDRSMDISGIRLIKKTGGRSGSYDRQD